MINKKLAALLASAVMLGQAGLMSGVLAQAEATDATSNSQEPFQLASIISHPDFNVNADQSPQEQPRDTADVFTIGNGPGTLPTVIQVLPQDDSTTSLFVNGAEILRFQGESSGMDSYTRVKTIASRLNQLLENNQPTAKSIRPALVNNLPVIQAGDQTLVTVDALSAKTAQETPLKLALLYSNRLRQALGQPALDDKSLENLADGAALYKSTGKVQTGMASWYGPYFHGRRSADGSRFNQFALTAAHRTLPFGTIVRVINQRTRKSCYVKITDRGPFAHGRIIDLSRGAAKKIDMLGSGVARVSVEVVQKRG
jgi:rare lipoprotein A